MMVPLLLIVLSVWEFISPGSEPCKGALCPCSASASLGCRLALQTCRAGGARGNTGLLAVMA